MSSWANVQELGAQGGAPWLLQQVMARAVDAPATLTRASLSQKLNFALDVIAPSELAAPAGNKDVGDKKNDDVGEQNDAANDAPSTNADENIAPHRVVMWRDCTLVRSGRGKRCDRAGLRLASRARAGARRRHVDAVCRLAPLGSESASLISVDNNVNVVVRQCCQVACIARGLRHRLASPSGADAFVFSQLERKARPAMLRCTAHSLTNSLTHTLSLTGSETWLAALSTPHVKVLFFFPA